MNQKKVLQFAVIFLLFALVVFLLSATKEKKERELVEDVHSTIDFDFPGA